MAKKTNENTKRWNTISALEDVLGEALSTRKETDWNTMGGEAYVYLKEKTGLSRFQCVFVALAIEYDHRIDMSTLGRKLDMTRLCFMAHKQEVMELFENYWIRYDEKDSDSSFIMEPNAQEALLNDAVYQPVLPVYHGNYAKLQADMAKFDSNRFCRKNAVSNFGRWMLGTIRYNTELPFVQKMQELDNYSYQLIVMRMLQDYSEYGGYNKDAVEIETLRDFYTDEATYEKDYTMFVKGIHPLQAEYGWVEPSTDSDKMDEIAIRLSGLCKSTLLCDFKLNVGASKQASADKDVILSQNIAEKELFYNAENQKQVDRLKQILDENNLQKIQSRLKEKGDRQGVPVLLCGGPGVGKTELVKQLARQSGRDLVLVDLSAIQSKWVGESEKNTQAIFLKYKERCKYASIKPILFINECDGLLGKRLPKIESSTDKMENTIQNILLENLENLEGIAICTTNLTENLDDAFARRFLYKLDITAPNVETRAKIIHSKLKDLSESDCLELASRYELSGGEIENVSRKLDFDYVLEGTTPTLASAEQYCKEEKMNKKGRMKPIGFAV